AIPYESQRFPSVGPGQLSLRNGAAGRPVSSVRLGFRGLLLNAYRTATGRGTAPDHTATRLRPSLLALAQCHWWSAPATANSSSLPPLRMGNSLPTPSKVTTSFAPLNLALRNTAPDAGPLYR